MTSWDDGHLFDLRLAELLAEYGIPGTFYVAPRNHELHPRAVLDNRGIVELVMGSEVGSHTFSHRRLTGLSDEHIRHELRDSCDYLERIVGQKVGSFCYPGGAYRRDHEYHLAEPQKRWFGFLHQRSR